MTKRKLGLLCFFLGAAMLLGAAALFAGNELENARAAQSVEKTLQQVSDEIQLRQEQPAPTETIPEATEPTEPTMTVVEIDGYGYIGYISIPRLKLELPVMSEWDDARLKIAPCRYSGTTMEENLVVMAHNYRKHFGPIRRLKPGDEVSFVDMDGVTTAYQVAATATVKPTAVEEVTSGAYDLTLFTCTYGAQTRVVVYCNTVEMTADETT